MVLPALVLCASSSEEWCPRSGPGGLWHPPIHALASRCLSRCGLYSRHNEGVVAGGRASSARVARRKLTQAALARRIDGHVMTISRLERGTLQPSMRMLQRLAKALNVPVTTLLE